MWTLKLGLLRRRLKSFERKIEKRGVSPERIEPLFHTLSVLANSFKRLEHLLPFAKSDISEHIDHIVSLYGRVVELSQHHQVSAIENQAHSIEEALHRSDLQTLSENVQSLKRSIHTFCLNNRPGKEGRQIIACAKRSAERAEATLHQRDLPPLLEHGEELEDAGELADALFEIGYLFFLRKQREGTRAFNQLPEYVKERAYDHLVRLGGNPFDLGMEVLKWQQALIATGFELTASQEGSYLSESAVDAFFRERTDYTETTSRIGL